MRAGRGLHRGCLTYALLLIGILAARPFAHNAAHAEPHPNTRQAALATLCAAYGGGGGDGATALSRYPIGVFDSGTGGLTVLEQILKIDAFDNATQRLDADGDGSLDFEDESFIFLADQANMPYGNYPVVGKESFLDSLILNDARFLLGTRYHVSSSDERARHDKLSVKALVIACNTATAYGKADIEQVLRNARVDIKVVGVVDAGAEGAVDVFADGEPGAIGVLATKGTVMSGAYPAAIRGIAAAKARKQRILVVQQGSLGLAGAIDGAPEFIVRNAASRRPRQAYRGPSLTHPDDKIDAGILARYDFDFSDHAMLYEGSEDEPAALQLNSVDNYIAYDVVSLLETIRRAPDPEPLRAVVLGCTHIPFYVAAIRGELQRLYRYRENGRYVYRPYMAERIRLIDPAFFTARNLYRCLAEDGRLRRQEECGAGHTRGEFYITVPCRDRGGVVLDESGWFTYDYKYGRDPGRVGSDYRAVPLRSEFIGADGQKRLSRQAPAVWKMFQDFRTGNGKLEQPAAATER